MSYSWKDSDPYQARRARENAEYDADAARGRANRAEARVTELEAEVRELKVRLETCNQNNNQGISF